MATQGRGLIWIALCLGTVPAQGQEKELPADSGFRAGAAAVEITPTTFPVIVNGMFEERTADRSIDKLHARALVFDDGKQQIAIVVVDSCGLPRAVCDEAKRLAAERTKIATDHICIAATHTHSAPSAWPVLGSDADAKYVAFLVPQIARSIELAKARLQPAEFDFLVARDAEHTHCRRWIRRFDRMLSDPFGEQTVRANMHPGHQSPDVIGPAGPTDPDISVVAVRSLNAQPIAVLANYSMHYFGSQPVSADYFGHFADALGRKLGFEDGNGKFVAIMSQGTSGDQMWMDYSKPAPKTTINQFADAVAQKVFDVLLEARYIRPGDIAMQETLLELDRRVPDEKRLKWAREIVAAMGDRKPRTQPEIYAREQILLAENPTAELKLQAIRIGHICMTAIPNEVFAITGLKLKAQSPLPTFNLSLANGCEGYIPPPEQHALGGYTTWPARSAGLEVQAEPQIVESLLSSLEAITEKKWRLPAPATSLYEDSVVADEPIVYWTLNELTNDFRSVMPGKPGNAGILATAEPGIVPYLEGPRFLGLSRRALLGNLDRKLQSETDPVRFVADFEQTVKTDLEIDNSFDAQYRPNRAAQFAGGRLRAKLPSISNSYAVEFWFRNSLPPDARPITAYLFSRGVDGDAIAAGDHLGIGGTHTGRGRLIFFNGNQFNQTLVGSTPLELNRWYHVALNRKGNQLQVYLNGRLDLSGSAEVTVDPQNGEFFFGGRNDRFALLEGRLDEIAVYDQVLSPTTISRHIIRAGEPLKLSEDYTHRDDFSPLPPQELPASALHSDSFRLQLVAAEPLTYDPVAIDWGPDGKLWIAEMADYPYGVDGKMKACGRVRYLEDTNNDGQYDKSTLFLENVNFPTGVMAWRQGVLVTAAPEIFYAADNNADGRADVRTVFYEGFNPGNPQLRVNGLQWGLDGWIYVANGLSGGKVKSLLTGKTVDIGGRDVRIKPESGELDAVSGQSEFGRNRDDSGNWFGSDNSNPLWHFALEDRYARRNPHYAPPDARHQLMTPANPPVFAISKLQQRFFTVNHDERFTSACSAIIYRDDLLFPGDRERGVQHAFVCEPVHNLIQHRVIKPSGSTFVAERTDDEQSRDFLASTDPWFRPVYIRTGPDGALWIVDMYRYMIEHPDWLPPEGKKFYEPHYRLGEDRGRIYRLLPRAASPSPVFRVDKDSYENLVALLAQPNGIVRDLAQRQLIARHERDKSHLLARLLHSSNVPVARLYALSTLNLTGELTREHLLAALDDSDPAVLRLALEISESRADDPEVAAAAMALVINPERAVRLQLACTLGTFREPRAGRALASLAVRSSDDPYLLAAVMSSLTASNMDTVLQAVTESSKDDGQLAATLLRQAVAFKRDEAVIRATNLGDPQLVAALLDAYARRGTSPVEAWQSLAPVGPPAITQLQATCQQARQTLADETQPVKARIAAIAALGFEAAHRNADVEQLQSLLDPAIDSELQIAVIDRLGQIGDAATPPALLNAWSTFSPSLRAEAMAALLSRTPWLVALLDRIEASKLSAADVDAAARERLLLHSDPSIRQRAGKLFAQSSNADRGKVVADYQSTLSLAGDPQRGAALFKSKCTQCHKLDGVGYEVGPNLAALSDKSPASYLTAILDPSRAVEAKYVNYLAATSDGRTHSGILKSESGAAITLLAGEGKSQTLLRSELDQLKSTGKSLMPEGFEKELTPQDLADLIAHLRAAK